MTMEPSTLSSTVAQDVVSVAAPTEGAGFDAAGSNNEEVPTAKFVEGNVGMAKGKFRKLGLRGLNISYRHGVLVINIGDGGSLSYYNHLKHPDTIPDDVPAEKVSFRTPLKKVSVHAIMESFIDQSEEPYLHIPASVQWKFKVVSEKSFRVTVPPTKGKIDYRVQVAKYGYMLSRMRMLNKRDSDDTIDSSETEHDPNKNSQIFEFRCHQSGELAIYAKAAQCLDRNLSGNNYHSLDVKNYIYMPSKNVRTRTETGIEIAAQIAHIDRTKSILRVKRMSIGMQEFRCFPIYCYPNTWMTKIDLAQEIPRSSKIFHDLRRGTPEEIGHLKLEILQCTGLPKMDRYSLSDAVCYVVCGSSTFVTDVIPDNCNPCWLPMSRRACILPIHKVCSQVCVGVFDYDGEKTMDDFIGRVVVDIPQLPSGCAIDFTLPLRQYSRIYQRKKLGSIRLRLQLNLTQHGERAALLAYFPNNLGDIRNRMKSPNNNPVTVVCPDAKTFYNVALTVYGKDIPGKYKKHTHTAVTREVKLIKEMLIYHTNKTAINVVRWRTPLLSAYLFVAWMHFVITSSMRLVPGYIMSLVFIFMLNNYVKYHVNSAAAKLFGHTTIADMTWLMLFRQDGGKMQNPQIHHRNNDHTILDRVLIRIFGTPSRNSDSWKFEDHAEYPFSIGSVDHKLSSSESAARPLWEAARDERRAKSENNGDDDDDFSDDGSKQEADDGNDLDYLSVEYSDSDDDSYDEYFNTPMGARVSEMEAHMKKAKVQLRTGPRVMEAHVKKAKVQLRKGSKKKIQQGMPQDQKKVGSGSTVKVEHSESFAAMAEHTKLCLPDQNVRNKSQGGGSTIQHQINKLHSKVQKANLHLFDDRVFVANDKADAEKILKMNTAKNPIARKINPMLADMIKIFEVEVSAFRAAFNILFWKDPFLSFAVLVMVLCLMVVLLIFPWQKFFFVVGILGLGPQNYFFLDWCISKRAAQKHGHQLLSKSAQSPNDQNEKEDANGKGGRGDQPFLRPGISPQLSLRNNIQMKPDGKLREIIVPSAPFRYNRFYDWPPDPASTTIK